MNDLKPLVDLKPFPKKEIEYFRASLLDWYDDNRRTLPWRAAQENTPVPYHVWLSEIMLQQTVVAAVIPYFLKFVEKWPTVHDLANAPYEDVMAAWAGLGYYARARNLHKCAQFVSSELHGKFPDTIEGLKALPGIGDYTSAAIMAIAFDKPATVVDGNVDRVMARYAQIEIPFPEGKKRVKLAAQYMAEGQAVRPGDFAQAMMDLGATICVPQKARCGLCPVHKYCRAKKSGIQDSLPLKSPKKAKPHKFGYVYWIENGKGDILIERRNEKEMLGGMLALPTSDWITNDKKLAHDSRFSELDSLTVHKKKTVHHSFTHFDLTLYGVSGRMPHRKGTPSKDVAKCGMPSLFVKASKLFT
jgi:A/G-specific adenine glycosylase